MLKLPIRPKRSIQLRYVRYWLSQLSQAHFKFGVYEKDVLSFEYIAMFFPPDEKVHKENFCLSFETLEVDKVIKEHKNFLFIDAFGVSPSSSIPNSSTTQLAYVGQKATRL
jgi:hypothetical protein